MNPGEEVDELIEDGRASMDQNTTVENYGEVQRIGMEEAGVIPLYYVEYLVGTYEDVGEFSPHPVMQMQRWASMENRSG
jgi:peptide/nickel transport system substrate-binding protein